MSMLFLFNNRHNIFFPDPSSAYSLYLRQDLRNKSVLNYMPRVSSCRACLTSLGALGAHVPYVPLPLTCLTCLHFLTCSTCLHCFTALRTLNFLCNLRVLPALIFTCLKFLYFLSASNF